MLYVRAARRGFSLSCVYTHDGRVSIRLRFSVIHVSASLHPMQQKRRWGSTCHREGALVTPQSSRYRDQTIRVCCARRGCGLACCALS